MPPADTDQFVAYIRERLATYPSPSPPIGPAAWAALYDLNPHNPCEATRPHPHKDKE